MNIQLKVRFGRQYPLGHNEENCSQQSHAESDPQSTAEKGEHQAFGKKLREDLPAGCAHRAPNRNLSLP